jgi:RNA polymerase sigma factor (sigma-70 family)
LNAIAFNRIVDELSNQLYRFALSMQKDEDEAKDAVQDAFAKLWERRDQVNPEKVKSYLFTTVHHKIIDSFRKGKRQQSIDETQITESVKQETHDLNAVLHEALNTLPEIQRSVILLRDYEGYNYEEIAEMTKLSLAQVKVYIFRGRQKLKQYIGSIEMVI